MPHHVFIGIGSNIGNRNAYYQRALQLIATLPQTRTLQQSSQYETEPLGDAKTWYLNGVIKIETAFAPLSLLHHLQTIEQALGRVRPAAKWTSRTMDLDILFFDNQIIDAPELHIPHPELHNRRFVLEPLAEIAPDFMHPRLKTRIADLLAVLEDTKQIQLFTAND